MIELCLWVLVCTDYLIVCFYHITYAFQSESTLYICLNVKEHLNFRHGALEFEYGVPWHSGKYRVWTNPETSNTVKCTVQLSPHNTTVSFGKLYDWMIAYSFTNLVVVVCTISTCHKPTFQIVAYLFKR